MLNRAVRIFFGEHFPGWKVTTNGIERKTARPDALSSEPSVHVRPALTLNDAHPLPPLPHRPERFEWHIIIVSFDDDVSARADSLEVADILASIMPLRTHLGGTKIRLSLPVETE